MPVPVSILGPMHQAFTISAETLRFDGRVTGMYQQLRSSCAVFFTCLVFGSDPAFAGKDCQQTALDHLRATARDGYGVYRQISQPDFFKGFITCDDAQFSLPTAVHESTHFVTAETDAFPLVGGGAIARPHEVSKFFPPTRIANEFKADDYATIYLRLGKASSSTDFLYLLDELNAYTHDLNAAVDLKALGVANETEDHRDGLAAMMAFVAAYAAKAQEAEPATWSGLQEPQVAKTVSAIWGRAERVMASSCGIPNFGIKDRSYIRQFCSPRARSALTPILGRAPVCPTACLNAAPIVEQASDGDTVDAPLDVQPHQLDESRSAAGPAWITRVIRLLSNSKGSEAAEPASIDRP
jgi:hypothetical protein